MGKPILVGEDNPLSQEEEYALYPYPAGCSGHRLCFLILDMRITDYFATFDRVNLCSGKWLLRDARVRARELTEGPLRGDKLILLGAKVRSAFGIAPMSFCRSPTAPNILLLPHPSGLCREWQREGAILRAREMVMDFIREDT